MRFLSFLIVAIAISFTSGTECDTAQSLQYLIELVNSIHRNGQICGTRPNSAISRSASQNAPCPVAVEMALVEERMKFWVEENRRYLMRMGEMCYMGMKSRNIPDSAITASSYHSSETRPHGARLDNQITHGNAGAWAARNSAIGQWLQIDLGSMKNVSGVIIQSRPVGQWVKTYKVSCGSDSGRFEMVKRNGEELVYFGNRMLHNKVYNRFPEALSCRYVRIFPQTWHEHMSMRVELVSGACFRIKTPWPTY